ncbi:hypothetical protein AB834_02395 [PVC group bacterium (ex Bugula neritina AB1)]|nr:hypothetical protein AB834_02395 [PVC group bacterium (ex Bugula neritina AB1)]
MKPLQNHKYWSFDFDRTLVEMQVDWGMVWDEVFKLFKENSWELSEGLGLHESIDEAASKYDVRVKKHFHDILQKYESGCSFTRNIPLLAVLEKSSVPWAIFSNNCKGTILSILETLDLSPSIIVAYEDVQTCKPSSEGLELILKHFSIESEPEKLIFVGDKVTDKKAADSADVPFFYVQDLGEKFI